MVGLVNMAFTPQMLAKSTGVYSEGELMQGVGSGGTCGIHLDYCAQSTQGAFPSTHAALTGVAVEWQAGLGDTNPRGRPPG
jgi:hypothetical protein